MPEVNFTPVNQCRIDDPSDGAELYGAPPATPEATASLSNGGCGFADVTARDSGHGADALVGRFNGEGGASFVEVSAPTPDCTSAELQMIGTCGAAALVTLQTGGLAAIFAGIACAGAIANDLRCETKKAD